MHPDTNKYVKFTCHDCLMLYQDQLSGSVYFVILLQLGTSAMDNTLLKYSAKDHFFKAVLCHLCIDQLNGQLALNKFKDMQPAFADSRECKFLEVRVLWITVLVY